MPIHHRMYIVEWTRANGLECEHEIDENSLLQFMGYIMQSGGKIDTVRHVVE